MRSQHIPVTSVLRRLRRETKKSEASLSYVVETLSQEGRGKELHTGKR